MLLRNVRRTYLLVLLYKNITYKLFICQSLAADQFLGSRHDLTSKTGTLTFLFSIDILTIYFR